ncbi:exopolysaccharide biosynthesis protein [Sulfitobacter sp.]|uniref:exopolysaccharide biosynthesis protein n=1 Tax=Sulfitobacter sp. TaxID=1903071 RepID=UPI003002D918
MGNNAEQSDGDGNGIASLIWALNLRSLSGRTVTLGDALDLAGARIHGVAILLMALPETMPLPIPSFGAILGIPLLIASLHLMAYGERGNLPDRARRIHLPPRMIEMMVRYLTDPLTRVERISHERLPALARRERLVGVMCVLMSVLLLMPVPLMNVPPAIVLVCLSWGLLQRDGLLVGLGIAMAVGVVMTVFALADLIIAALAGIAT